MKTTELPEPSQDVSGLKPFALTGRRRGRWVRNVVGCGLVMMQMSSCRQDMHDQPRYEPLEASSFFPDGQSSRSVVEGTVARGQLQDDRHFFTGKVEGQAAETLPMNISRELLSRGQERYEIYCSPCHGSAGYGEGIIVARGFRRPPSFHIDRLRQAPVGHFFEVMTNGLGAMYSYASRVDPADRWAIIAYIRALQLSQYARPEDVPSEELNRLRETN